MHYDPNMNQGMTSTTLPQAGVPPAMTADRAKQILKETIQLFSLPENRSRLEAAIAEAAQAPPDQQHFVKMQKLLPLITGMAGDKLREYGLPNVRRHLRCHVFLGHGWCDATAIRRAGRSPHR